MTLSFDISIEELSRPMLEKLVLFAVLYFQAVSLKVSLY
jgi:hypothetical protein